MVSRPGNASPRRLRGMARPPRLRRARLFRARRRETWMAKLAQTARSAPRPPRVRSGRFACGAPPPLCADGRDPDFRVRRLCLAWTGLRLWIRQAELWRRLESRRLPFRGGYAPAAGLLPVWRGRAARRNRALSSLRPSRRRAVAHAPRRDGVGPAPHVIATIEYRARSVRS